MLSSLNSKLLPHFFRPPISSGTLGFGSWFRESRIFHLLSYTGPQLVGGWTITLAVQGPQRVRCVLKFRPIEKAWGPRN
jgi:hypothetical protein